MSVKNLTIPFVCVLVLTACGRRTPVREYTEVLQAPEQRPARSMEEASAGRDAASGRVPSAAAGEAMRAPPLTVEPVPENLPEGHPTLPSAGRRTQEMGQAPVAPGADMMRGREGEVPPPPAARDLRWEVPEGWRQHAGTGMRLASFSVEGDDSGALTTLIVLSGEAGRIEANIQRWRRQMELPVEPSGPSMRIEGALRFTFVDLTGESLEAGREVSTVGAMYDLGDRTAFLKFTGPPEVLRRERVNFLKLAGSLRVSKERP